MKEKISIELDRSDWVELAKFLSRKCGEMVNILPLANLLTQLDKNEVAMEELR